MAERRSWLKIRDDGLVHSGGLCAAPHAPRASWEFDRRTVCYKTAIVAKHWWSPIAVGVLFLGVSHAILMWYTLWRFVLRPRSFRRCSTTRVRCTLWDFVSSVCVSAAARSSLVAPKLAPLARAVITGVGVASLPFWIYRGSGVFLFQGTWADVSCVFTEGFGLAFPIVVAPARSLQSATWIGCPATAARSCRIV